MTRSRRPSRADVSRALAADVTGEAPPAHTAERLAVIAGAAPAAPTPRARWRRGLPVLIAGGALAAGVGASYATGVVSAPWQPSEGPSRHSPLEPSERATPSPSRTGDLASDSPSDGSPSPDSSSPDSSRPDATANGHRSNGPQDRAPGQLGDDQGSQGNGKPTEPGKPDSSQTPRSETTPGTGTGKGKGHGPGGVDDGAKGKSQNGKSKSGGSERSPSPERADREAPENSPPPV